MRRKSWIFFLLILMGGCSGLVRLQLPPADREDSKNEWLTLGGNPQRQHFATKDIVPPLAVAWDKSVKSVVADHPLARGDYVFAPTISGIMYMIHAETGEGLGDGKLTHAISNVPTIHHNLMYAGSTLGKKTLISFDLEKADRVLHKRYPYISTAPLVVENRIFFGTTEKLFICADVGTGEKIWEFETTAAIHSSPALSVLESVIFADEKGRVYALDAASGSSLWEKDLPGNIFSHPVLDDSLVFIGTVTGEMHALEIQNGRTTWSRTVGGAIYSSPSLYRNMLYFGHNGHEVIALHKNSGDLIWKFRTRGMVNTVPLPSPNYLYVTSWDKNLYVLNRFTGESLFTFPLKRPSKSSPIIYKDYLLIHLANDKLLALASEKFIQARREKK